MANFRDLVKQQRGKGGGVIGSLGTALSQKTLEKIDPRNYIFSKSGLMTALFPGLKGYQAGKTDTPSPKQIEKALAPAPVFDKEMSTNISRIDSNTRLTAKNSMVMPMMARDMNLMRQNMAKLVRISSRGKETGATKADMFFKRSAEREKAYESKFKKDRSLFGIKPKTAEDAKAPSSGKGIFSSLFGGLLGGLGSIAGGLLSLGGSLIGGIASMIGGVGGAIFRTIGAGLSIMGPLGLLLAAGAGFLIYQLSKSINFEGLKDSFKGLLGMKEGEPSLVQRITDTLKEALGYDKNSNLAGEIAKSLDKTFKTDFFKDALLAITTTFDNILIEAEYFYEEGIVIFNEMLEEIKALAVGVAAAIGGYALADKMIGIPGGGGGGKPGGKAGGLGRGLSAIGRAGSRYGVAGAAGMGGKMLGRGAMALASGVGRAALAAFGPFGVAIGAGMLAYDLYKFFSEDSEADSMKKLDEMLKQELISQEDYDYLKNYVKNRKEIEKIQGQLETLQPSQVIDPETGTATQVESSATIDQRLKLQKDLDDLMQKQQKLEEQASAKVREEESASKQAKEAQKAKRKSDKDARKEANEQRRSKELYGTGDSTSPTPVSGDYASRIGQYESGGKYDTVYGQAGGAKINGKSITENTIAEVAAWQDSERKKKTNRHAAGKYQFMDVRSAAALAGIGPNELFNAQNQDKMMQAFTNKNAEYLKARGIEPNAENLAMAHAVGAGGAAALLTAQKGGSGSANALDVLGLTGEARTTNPHLNKSVNEVVASLQSRGKGAAMPGAAPTPSAPKPEENKTYFDFFDKIAAGGKETMSNLFAKGGINEINLRINGQDHKLKLSEFLDDASRKLQDQKNEPPTIVIPPAPPAAPVAIQQGMNAPVARGVVDRDFMELLFRRAAGEVMPLPVG